MLGTDIDYIDYIAPIKSGRGQWEMLFKCNFQYGEYNKQ